MKASAYLCNRAGASGVDVRKSLLRSVPRTDETFIPKPGTTRSVEAKLVNPLHERDWDESVSSHPQATIFHSSAWARVLSETYGHRPCYLRISARDEPLALVPMMEVQTLFTKARGVCLPFSDSCAPLLLTTFGKELVVKKLRQVARERNWKYFELRADSLLPEDATASESYYGHVLDLQAGSSALYFGFTSSVQRAIRKAQRNGLTASVRSSSDAMDQFYNLHVRTRHKHGVPPQPRAFFASIQKNIINAGLGFIVVVERAEDALAAAMFFRAGNHAVYKFGASDQRAQELRPNNLAMFEAVKFLADAGARSLHFGRTDMTNEGLRRFKLSWGASEEQISYGKFNILADNWVGSRNHRPTFHNRIFRSLPVSVNRLAGSLLYPHLD